MCLVVLLFQKYDDAPVIVAANREELYVRGGEPPQRLPGGRRAIGGFDPTAGGTWLGVNECGLLIAVTNRPKQASPASPRSRGLLARDLLNCAAAAESAEMAMRELWQNRYGGCNFLCVDFHDAFVIHAGDTLSKRKLPAGLHLLTASDVNDENDKRQRRARRWLATSTNLAAGPVMSSDEVVGKVQQLCGLTGEVPMCLRHERGGTVSSSVIALRRPREKSVYLHAQGPPDQTPYEDYSPLLREILSSESGAR